MSAPAQPSPKRGTAADSGRSRHNGRGRPPERSDGGARDRRSGDGRRPGRGGPPPGPQPAAAGEQPRPLYTAGGIAAAWAAGVGLVVITTLTVVGWVAAPHGTFGEDFLGVFRTAVQGWLVGHNVGFGIPGGRVTMLPLGLVVLPGLLLYRAGRWLARSCELPRLRHVFRAALAIAGPYAAICGTLALIGQTEVIRPSMPQALVAGFVLAFLAGGLGALLQLLKDKGIPRRRLLSLMPERPRSLLVGTASATGLLLLAGAVLFCASLIAGFEEAAATTRELEPGVVGGALLLAMQLIYVPNAVVFGVAYAVGPGFAVGAGTMVAPTGVAVGPLPLFPMLAALPENGPAPALSIIALAAPFLAGGVAGVLTQRSAPTVVSEAAPLWGFVCGVTTGLVCAALSILAGGPLGAERLATVGPSPWQVGLITALEVGVAAAITAWLAHWRYFRAAGAEGDADSGAGDAGEDGESGDRAAPAAAAPAARPARPAAAARPRPRRAAAVPPVAPARPVRRPVADPGPEPVPDNGGPEEAAPRPARRGLRLPAALRWGPRRGAAEEDDAEAEELYGITYEAAPEALDPAAAGAPEERDGPAG
ncbi:DUF6350 family protein [Nocardiopsis mangrovi]|uniref:DUF6350 family protein n=1 Tax=Nocardiopsis mangrovi TaxID=1179818 RepID=A0ABV9E840_9ACTN